MKLSPRVSGIELSITLALDARAKELAAAGREVVNMSVGEPDFESPPSAREGAIAVVQGNRARYTPAAGTPALRKAIAAYVSRTRGTPYVPEEITVCHSTKHALSGAMLSLVEPGDEVLLLLPAWVSYVEIVRIAGGVPVSVPSRPDCGPDFAAIERALTPRTKVLLVNSPNNPSGYVFTPQENERLARLCVERGLWILSDEIYRRLVYDGEPNPSPASVSKEARAQTVVLDGASKVFAMTGYRIGFVAAPRAVAEGVERLHSHLVGCPNAISQGAYLAALQSPGGEPPEVQRMVAEFARRREVLLEGLEKLGLRTPRPRGAFYAFPDVTAYLDERGSSGFCSDLLEQHDLAIVPGSAFGMDQHVRLSYATSLETIGTALARLGDFLHAHPRRPRAARR